MSETPTYLQLNLRATEAHRMFWNSQYFNIEAVLLLDSQIESKEQAQKNLEKCSLIVKMSPFKNEFQAKLFSHITGEDKQQESKIIALTASLNIFEKKVLDILDIREAAGIVNAYASTPINPDEAHPLKLTDKEKGSLIQELQKLVEGNMLAHLREPFVSFFPEFVTDAWKERMPKGRNKGALIPYQGLFPYSGTIERVYKDTLYALDDLYCVTPGCDCNEANAIVLTFDSNSGKEVVHGGFKYHLQKKIFKNLPDFPAQFNAQEWFKQFSAAAPIKLTTLFESRYHFLRNLVINSKDKK